MSRSADAGGPRNSSFSTFAAARRRRHAITVARFAMAAGIRGSIVVVWVVED